MCHYCFEINPDEHIIKCRATIGCLGRSPKVATDAQNEPKPGISKVSQKLIDEADPGKLKAEIEKLNANITELDTDILKYDSADWKHVTAISTDHFKNKETS